MIARVKHLLAVLLWLFHVKGRPKVIWLYQQAQSSAQEGNWERAAFFSRAAIESDPTLAEAHLMLGFAQMRSGELAEARSSFARTIQLAPGDPYPHAYLGDMAWEQRNWSEAEAELRKAVDLQDDRNRNPQWMLDLAAALQQLGRVHEAISLLERLRSIAPEYVKAVLALGEAHNNLGEYAKALPLLREATERAPSSASAHYNLAYALGGLGRWEEARIEARKAIELEPSNALYREGLAAMGG